MAKNPNGECYAHEDIETYWEEKVAIVETLARVARVPSEFMDQCKAIARAAWKAARKTKEVSGE